MSFFKKILLPVFVILILNFFFSNIVWAQVIFDNVHPTTTINPPGDPCTTIGNTTSCPNTSSVTPGLICNDTPEPPDGGCMNTYFDINPTGTACITPSYPPDPDYTLYAPSAGSPVVPTVNPADGAFQTLCVFSVDYTGNVESPAVEHNMRFVSSISGNVYIDANHNGTYDAGDTYYTTGATVTLSGVLYDTEITNDSGAYAFTNLPGGNYAVALTVPSGYTASTTNPVFVTVDTSDIVVNFGITNYSISGSVFTDFDNNGAFDGSDANSTGRTVELYDAGNNLIDTQTTAGSGDTNYAFTDLAAGTYTVKLTVPASYKASTFTGNCSPSNCIGAAIVSSNTITITVTDAGADFGITPLYKIEGTLFNDADKNRVKNGESAYSASTQEFILTRLADNETTTITTNNGEYSFSNLLTGDYKVEYSKTPVTHELPTGYELTYPQNASYPFYTNVTVGPSCVNPPPGGNRSPADYCWQATGTPFTGSIRNLDFGISNSIEWFQCQGADCREDDGIIIPIPDPDPDPTDACESYASTTGPLSTSPGILYSGDNTASFCSGGTCNDRSSVNQWIVGAAGDTLAPFNPVNSTVIRTSYSYMTTTARQSGITPTTLSATECGAGGIASCDLSTTTLSNGIYVANGDLTLVGTGSPPVYIFPKLASPATNDYVILVNGKLNIDTNLIVPIGTTVTFSASDDIHITNKNVGVAYDKNCDPTAADHETSPNFGYCNIEGFFSTDKSFIIDGYGADGCATPPIDNRLNIAGSVVVNAALGGGSIQNNRDLCENNIYCPVFSIVERPDLILNSPDFIKHPNYIWQEVAP